MSGTEAHVTYYQQPAELYLYHVYNPKHPGAAFNPAPNLEWRFSSIYNCDGTVCPVYYAAADGLGAIAETVTRLESGRRQLSADFSQRHLAIVRPSRELKLVDLQTYIPEDDPDEPHPAGERQAYFQSLLANGKEAYAELRAVAQNILLDHPDADGITWFGYQLGTPGRRCMMLFEKPDYTLNLESDLPLAAPGGLDQLKDACIHLDYPIPDQLTRILTS